MSLWNFLDHMKRISYIQDILLKRWLTSLSEIVIYIWSNLRLNSKCRSIQTDNYPCVLLHRLLHLIRWCSLKVNTVIDANEVIFQHAQGSQKLWITTLISSTPPANTRGSCFCSLLFNFFLNSFQPIFIESFACIEIFLK